MKNIAEAAMGNKNAMPVAYEQRIFTYQPEATRLVLFFLSYQVKNTYDTIVWNDGILFILHHVLCLFTAYGALIPGSCHFYVPFYFGVSEASTAVLCLLANFDDVHGAVGLADAFPLVKAVIGGIFALLFIICRVFMWSTVSVSASRFNADRNWHTVHRVVFQISPSFCANVQYYYCRDAWNALQGSDPRMKERKIWLMFTFVSLALLSVLQILWLGEIFLVGKEELKKLL
jgi:hypothetical protein